MANTTISIRSSGDTGVTPSLGVLANGELALNFADGILYYKTVSNTLGTITTTEPAGLNKEIQFNDSGSFGSNAGLTFDKTTGTFIVPSLNVASVYSLPTTDGTNGQLLTTDGSGTITFQDPTTLPANVIVSNFYTTANGVVDTFDLGFNPVSANNLTVSVDGVLQTPTLHYTVNTVVNTITFDSTPPASSNIAVVSLYTNVNTYADVIGTAAFAHANGAFDAANGASTLAQNAYDYANTIISDTQIDPYARAHANGAFDLANGTAGIANTDVTDVSATAGTYGSASEIPSITIAANGRVTTVTTNSIDTTTAGLAYDHANGAFDAANTSQTHAEAAFTQANTNASDISTNSSNITTAQNTADDAQTHAEGAFTQANTNATSITTTNSRLDSAFTHANSGYDQANTATTDASSAQTHAEGAFTQANTNASNITTAQNTADGAFTAANTAQSTADGAQTHAEGAFTQANTNASSITTTNSRLDSAFGHANAAYTQANTATTDASNAQTHAEAAFTQANTNASNVTTAQNTADGAYTHANGAFDAANTKFASAGGTISGDTTITGNLTVQGTTTQVDSTTVKLGDNIVTINAAVDQASAPVLNAGIEVDRGSSANVSLLWNETDDKWTFTNDGSTYSPIADADRLDSSFTHANSAYDTANTNTTNITTAQAHADGAFDHANGAFTAANTAQSTADGAQTHAEAAFTQANTNSTTDYTNVSVTADTYGNSTAIPSITIASNGRITSVTTASISTDPAGNDTELQFNDGGSFGSNTGLTFDKTTGTFTAPSVNVASAFVLPTTDGTANQVMITDGTGQLSWADQSGSGASASVTVNTFNDTANGSVSSFDLGFTPVSEEAIIVTIDGVVQPEADYSVSSQTITFVDTPLNGEDIRVVSLYTSANLNTTAPSDGTVTPASFATEANTFIQQTAHEEAVAMAIALG